GSPLGSTQKEAEKRTSATSYVLVCCPVNIENILLKPLIIQSHVALSCALNILPIVINNNHKIINTPNIRNNNSVSPLIPQKNNISNNPIENIIKPVLEFKAVVNNKQK